MSQRKPSAPPQGDAPAQYNVPREGERVVSCPQCRGPSVYAQRNPFRPFCSARCKGVDLGAWASEDFRVAADPAPGDDFEGNAAPLPH